MANMTVKNIPDAVYQEIKDVAARRGRSLNGLVIELPQDCADEEERRRRRRESWERYRTLDYLVYQV